MVDVATIYARRKIVCAIGWTYVPLEVRNAETGVVQPHRIDHKLTRPNDSIIRKIFQSSLLLLMIIDLRYHTTIS